MINKFFLFFFFTMCVISVYSQTIITGTVKNKKGEPMYVTITLHRPGAKAIYGFTSTDNEGNYKVTYKGGGDSLMVAVRGLAVERAERIIPNRSATIDFVLKEKINRLKEVRVSASPIQRRGDTLNYAVSVFKGQSDRTIEDVMKKLPGIEVSKSGAISYNGKNINKFYIEDLDMLEGRYNIATRNIKAEDVASVQIYENHQPIKALTMFSDKAAINLKLKDKAKGVWTINASLGAGYQPALWNAELTAMHFARVRQNISMYKGNNSGYTSEDEFRRHYDAGVPLPGSGGMLSVSTPRMPNVDKKRYTENITHSITFNQLVKVKKIELTANVNYYNEHLDKEGYSSSTQYMPEGNTPLIVEETMTNSSKENNLDLSLRIKKNEKTQYIRNNLDVKSSWNQTFTDILTKSNTDNKVNSIHQHLDRPYLSIGNALDMLSRFSKHSFRINLKVGYSNRPHELKISPAHYFSADKPESLSQEVVQKNITAAFNTSYGVNIGDFSLNYTPKFNMNLCNLTSGLTSIDGNMNFVPASDDLRNELWYNTYQVGVDQDYTYSKFNRLKIRLTIPTYFNTIVNDDRLANQSVSNKKLIVNPSLGTSYDISPSFKASVSGYYRKSYGNFNDSYKGYILKSYRNLLRNTSDRQFESGSAGGNISFEYRNAINMIFFNIIGSYNHSNKNILYGYNYDGIVGVKTTLDRPTDSDSYNIYAATSKSFSFWKTKIDASGGFNMGESELLLQDKIQPYHTQGYYAGTSINTTPCRFLNFAYKFSWMKSRQWTDKGKEDLSFLRTHSHKGELWIFPTESLSLNFNVDYQYYNDAGYDNMVFADAMLRYRYRETEWELECNNLFNAKQYVSTTYSGMGTYVSRYELRPINFLLKVRFKIK